MFFIRDDATLKPQTKLLLSQHNIIFLQHSGYGTNPSHSQMTGHEVWQPNYHFIHSLGFKDVIDDKFIAMSYIPLRNKIPQLYWRGTMTGMPFFENNTRLRLCNYSQDKPWLNAKITADFFMSMGITSYPIPEVVPVYEPRNMSGNELSWLKYRGVFDVDGWVDACELIYYIKL
jgi:hypothetical protein